MSATATIGVAALVAASVIGNRVNRALPRGFGLAGMIVTAGLVCAVLVVLIAPDRIWQHARIVLERHQARRGPADFTETQRGRSYDHSAWLMDDDREL